MSTDAPAQSTGRPARGVTAQVDTGDPPLVFTPPQRVLDSFERRRQALASRIRPCGAGVGRGLTCGVYPARPYPRGWRCSTHAPADQIPDPARTLDALRAAAGLRPEAFAVGRTVVDNRAEDSGRRVSSARRAAARGPAIPRTPEEP